MTHSHESQSTRWQWQVSVLPLLIVVLVVATSTSSHAQSGPSIPPLPNGTNVSQGDWKIWHERSDEGWAAYNIGRTYHQAFRLNKDDSSAAKNAFDHYEKASKSENANAQANLGYCYDKGIGTEENQEEAKRWYGLAAKQGNLIGQLNYAQKLLVDGIKEVNRSSLEQALSWFNKAYAQDSSLTEAAYGIGMAYANLPGATAKDLGKARTWLTKANDQHQALFALGWLDEQQKRYGTAVEIYKKARDRGSLAAAFNLARCRENGLGVAMSKQEAIVDYLYAAERGHAVSQYALALLRYDTGNSPEDYMDAFKWWRVAEKNGLGEARTALRQIQQSRLLTREEIAIAEREATKLDRKIRSTIKSLKPKEPPYNRNIAIASVKKPTHKFSGFLITKDGWVLTSSDHIEMDPVTKKLTAGNTIKVKTHAGTFPATADIVVSTDRGYAVLKIDGTFNSLPLSANAPEDSKDKVEQMHVITTVPNDNDLLGIAYSKGKVEFIQDIRQKDYFEILTGKFDVSGYSNFLSYNALGQATGIALIGDQKSSEKLKVLKSSSISSFLKNKVPAIEVPDSPLGGQPSEPALKDLARQAIVTVMIYNN